MTEKIQATTEEKALGTAVAAYLIAQAAATKHAPADQKELAELLRAFIASFKVDTHGLPAAAIATAQYRLDETAGTLEHNAAQ
ncbi:hypothetical protein RA224_09585 [Achromobacter aegrifaciens]|uniref:hypothetical protein n=1 Tax=Achromobacter aegrifaciens TaxID=1287736 RepID=UPI0027BA134E|nr:hypothetical protein [Achromobacter aegrifaciens]WLW63654.1 hypothetical protein RA224_09585 [Achromobacter aegrifaciens]